MATKKKIIDKILARLSTIEAINPNFPSIITTGKNSFREFDAAELPLIRVMFEQGDAEWFNNAIEYKHTEQIVIDYVENGNNDDLDDALYSAEEAIRDFIIKDHNSPEDPESLYFLFDEIKYQGWNLSFEKGDISLGAIRLRFEVVYYTKHVKTYDDLTTLDVEIKPADAGDDSAIIANDIITLPDS